jgi:hypothetical protein
MKIFNDLPKVIKGIYSKTEMFKTALKHYLQTHSFYTVDDLLGRVYLFSGHEGP